MAVEKKGSIKEFEDWYNDRTLDHRGTGAYSSVTVNPCGAAIFSRFQDYQREMDARVHGYEKLVMMADAEVVTKQPDLPNVSSGEAAGIVRRMARNLVQNTPNVEVSSTFGERSSKGIFVKYILRSKIVGDDQYSNNMQQNLFASAKSSLTLGFDTVIPVLSKDAGGGWFIKYDNIHYRDVFPEPGVRDVRDATEVFVRRYLTKGEILGLIRENAAGWDHAALKTLIQSDPPPKQRQSIDHQTAKSGSRPSGYEIITQYTNTGEPFLTFDARTKYLLRIEQNKHPLKWHPVHFLVMEKDLNQPLGKSQVELIYGRQEFQDLLLNGAMKQWYRNINPSIIGYGTVNASLNLSPGKYTEISNPNARLEAFEVNSQTLLQHGSISQQNAGNMVQLVGAADQQMASQGTGGMMSQTPQGVNAQQEMVDITTNNYQKAIEAFFSRYCSYALNVYFAELKGYDTVTPTADARDALIAAGMEQELFKEDGTLEGISFKDLAVEYWVRAVPGSLIEMEDEKQLRILNELFVPLSQALPALAQTQDPSILSNAAAAMQFIIQRQIELSGSAHSKDLSNLWVTGETARTAEEIAESELATETHDTLQSEETAASLEAMAAANASLQEQMSMMRESMDLIMSSLGVHSEQTTPVEQDRTTV